MTAVLQKANNCALLHCRFTCSNLSSIPIYNNDARHKHRQALQLSAVIASGTVLSIIHTKFCPFASFFVLIIFQLGVPRILSAQHAYQVVSSVLASISGVLKQSSPFAAGPTCRFLTKIWSVESRLITVFNNLILHSSDNKLLWLALCFMYILDIMSFFNIIRAYLYERPCVCWPFANRAWSWDLREVLSRIFLMAMTCVFCREMSVFLLSPLLPVSFIG